MINSFGISIREVLELDILKGAKVLAGQSGLDRRVTKVNVMEVPDILDWVTPGEFLLTTAYSIKDDIHQLDALIPKLKQKQVAGIGIKTKRYVDEIPSPIIERSNQHGFPLIEIPYDVSFSEIIMPVLTEIINKQTMTLTRIYEFHSRLIDTIIHGGSLQEIALAIHQSIGNPVTISENIFRTHVTAAHEGFEETVLHLIEEELDETLLARHASIHREDTVDGTPCGRRIIPIKVDDAVYGHIDIWETNKVLAPVEVAVVTASTSIITLDLLKKLSIYQIENKHRTEFFDNLFSTDALKFQRAVESKMFFPFKEPQTYTVMIASLRRRSLKTDSYPLEKLARHLDRIATLGGDRILYANKGDQVIILVGSDRGLDEPALKERIDRLVRGMTSLLEGAQTKPLAVVGIGRHYQEISGIRSSYEEARRVIDYLEIRDDVPILYFEDMGIYRILSYHELKPELGHFFTDILAPLVQYDREKGQDLVETLRRYFEHRGNIKKVSDAMYTHYNTIVYRMNRIKEITQMDFEDSDDYLNMQIAIKIHDLMKR